MGKIVRNEERKKYMEKQDEKYRNELVERQKEVMDIVANATAKAFRTLLASVADQLRAKRDNA